ncbi:polyphosphate polymerase domain-containing protein [Marinobacteraceae bacterium S3BR75-40.1]
MNSKAPIIPLRSEKPSLGILHALAALARHGLDDLPNTRLQNRVDTKYMLPLALLTQLLEAARTHYSVLDINGSCISQYQTTYLDTADFRCFHMHHRGELERYKVRLRQYINSGQRFLEIKHKTNQKRTHKTRQQLPTPPSGAHPWSAHHDFLTAQLPRTLHELSPSQSGRYQRIALASDALGERVTLDFDLHYQSLRNGTTQALDNIVIVEVKQHRLSKHSPFIQLLTRLGVRPISFSKYCIGCCLTQPELKRNLFKPTLAYLAQLNHEEAA